jgi:hypothetical protein
MRRFTRPPAPITCPGQEIVPSTVFSGWNELVSRDTGAEVKAELLER